MRIGAIESGLIAAILGILIHLPLVAERSAAAVHERHSALIGYACGPTEVTEYRAEEDEFTAPCARVQARDEEDPVIVYLSPDEAEMLRGQVYEADGECREIRMAGREGYMEFRSVPC